MKDTIVQSSKPVILVGGGVCPENALTDALTHAKCVVAADGGAAKVLACGRIPDMVIGDMDSLAPELWNQLGDNRLCRIDEQDSTDFDKCLRHISAPLILGYGFLGARLDHELAALNVLARRPDIPCILVGEDDVVAVVPAELSLDLPVGTRFSLFPMRPVTGTSQGLKWPIDGIRFEPGGRTGTSNEVTGPVHLLMDGPGMLILLPLDCELVLRAALVRLGEPRA